MRKKTINHLADTVFWYILYFLPVLCYLFYLIAEPSSGITSISSMETFFTQMGINFAIDNTIFTSLTSIFGSSGVFPLFSTTAPIFIFTWFISVYICHLLVDFLLFIPRLCHKYMKTFTQGE